MRGLSHWLPVLAASAALGVLPAAQATVVLSNAAAPGDLFTTLSTTNTGQAVGASGWYYNNVRTEGAVGVNNTYARSGNGSAYLETKIGPGGASTSKADIEFFGSATANAAGNYSAASSLGKLGELSALSYDWYRDGGTSGASTWLHPTIRLQILSADRTKFGYIVFEREINNLNRSPTGVQPTDTWVTDDVFGSNYRMWSTGSLPNTALYYDALTIGQWVTDYRDYDIVGISLGVGSGWGAFKGAVDNVNWTIGNQSYSFNFEVPGAAAVPEPGALLLAGTALLGLLAGRRRMR